MSQENVEAFRRITEALNASPTDPSMVEPLLHSGYRIDNIVTAVTDKTYYGAAGIVAWFSDMADAFASGVRWEMEAVIADSRDFVVARMAFVGTGARSSAPLQLRWIAVSWFRDGRATRSVGYANRHEALKAVGLEE